MKYIHKPTEIEAVQYTGDNKEEINPLTQDGTIEYVSEGRLAIINPNGELTVNVGDYVIKGEKEGDYWVCASDVFEKSYEVKE